MDNIKTTAQLFEDIESKYDLPQENIKGLNDQIDHFKVYVPLIGRFSAGKSALINTLLDFGIDLCAENISPQTAIPAEISYEEEEAVVLVHGQEQKTISMEDYFEIKNEVTAETTSVVKIYTNNENLLNFPDIALVDMPGLDSGYEVHDKAIHEYIQNSMAYVLVFPGDDLTIPKSMEPILYELDAYKMPMCVVITKGNRIRYNEEEQKENLRKSLSKYYSQEDIPIFVTEKEDGRVEEFKEYLETLQTRAREIGVAYYKKRLEPEFSKICNYLCGQLKSMEMSISQLEEQKDSLEQEIAEISHTTENEMTRFEKQIPQIIDGIAGEVQAALSDHLEEYVFDLVHDTDITTSLQEMVKKVVADAYEKRVIGQMKKHLNVISHSMSMGSTNTASTLLIDIDKVCGKEISGVSRAVIDVVAAILSGGIFGGVLAHLFVNWMNKKNQQKREEAENKVRQELTEHVFPAIDQDLKAQLDVNLHQIFIEFREMLEHDMGEQIAIRQKSLDDVMQQKELQDAEREQRKQEIIEEQDNINRQWDLLCE